MIDLEKTCMRCMSPLPENAVFCQVCGAGVQTLRNTSDQLPIRHILGGKYLIGAALEQKNDTIAYTGMDLNLNLKVQIVEYFPDSMVERDPGDGVSVRCQAGEDGNAFETGKRQFLETAGTFVRLPRSSAILALRDYFSCNGTVYTVTECPEGRTLRAQAVENGGKLPAGYALPLLRPVADTLARLHEAGVVLGNVGTDAIIIRQDGTPVLTDLSAARQISGGDAPTVSDAAFAGGAAQAQATAGEDVYGFCAAVYEVLTGVRPPRAADRTPFSPLLPPPNVYGANLPDGQQSALMGGLSADPATRCASMAALIRGLYSDTSGLSGNSVQSVVTGQQSNRGGGNGTKKKSKLPLILAGVAGVVIIVLLIALLGGKSKGKDGPLVAASGVEIPKVNVEAGTVEDDTKDDADDPVDNDAVVDQTTDIESSYAITDLVAHASYYERSPEDISVIVVVEIENTGKVPLLAVSYENEFLLKDGSGAVLDKGYLSYPIPPVIQPGEKGYLCGSTYYEGDGKNRSFQVTPTLKIKETDGAYTPLTLKDTMLIPKSYGGMEYQYTLVNDTGDSIEEYGATIGAVLFDKSGKVFSFLTGSNSNILRAGQSETDALYGMDSYLYGITPEDIGGTEAYAFVDVNLNSKILAGTPEDEAPTVSIEALSDAEIKEGATPSGGSKTSKPSATPVPEETPEENDAEIRTYEDTITVDGKKFDVYVADVSAFEFGTFAYWNDKQVSIGTSYGCPVILRGQIDDCYGVTISYSGTVSDGDPFSVPWKPMIMLSNGAWMRSRGDATFTYTGGTRSLDILMTSPSSFSRVAVIPSKDVGGNWSVSHGINVLKLYFATEGAMERYFNTVAESLS